LYLSVLVARCAVLPKLWLFNSLESVGSIIYVSRSVCQPAVILGCGKAYVVGNGQVLLWDSVLAGELANAACVIRCRRCLLRWLMVAPSCFRALGAAAFFYKFALSEIG
jgi:hypothetical protein